MNTSSNNNPNNLPLFEDLDKAEFVPTLEDIRNKRIKTIKYWETENDYGESHATYALVEKKDKFTLLAVSYITNHYYAEVKDFPKNIFN